MSDETDRLVAAQAAVDGMTRKIEKLKAGIDEAKDALAIAKDDLRAAKAEAKNSPTAAASGDNDVAAFAEAAEIKSEGS